MHHQLSITGILNLQKAEGKGRCVLSEIAAISFFSKEFHVFLQFEHYVVTAAKEIVALSL